FSTVHSFNSIDGASPFGGLILSGNTLYGTTQAGGDRGGGTVFTVKTDGTSFTNLHSFTYSSDGDGPSAGLILSGNILYGTTEGSTFIGGPAQYGSVFAMNTNGTGFTNLYLFIAGSDGAYPSGLI